GVQQAPPNRIDLIVLYDHVGRLAVIMWKRKFENRVVSGLGPKYVRDFFRIHRDRHGTATLAIKRSGYHSLHAQSSSRTLSNSVARVCINRYVLDHFKSSSTRDTSFGHE